MEFMKRYAKMILAGAVFSLCGGLYGAARPDGADTAKLCENIAKALKIDETKEFRYFNNDIEEMAAFDLKDGCLIEFFNDLKKQHAWAWCYFPAEHRYLAGHSFLMSDESARKLKCYIDERRKRK